MKKPRFRIWKRGFDLHAVFGNIIVLSAYDSSRKEEVILHANCIFKPVYTGMESVCDGGTKRRNGHESACRGNGALSAFQRD